MPSFVRTQRVAILVVAATILAALSLACGMSGTSVPACQNAPNGDECNACCTREGYSGHSYNSMGTPPCGCI